MSANDGLSHRVRTGALWAYTAQMSGTLLSFVSGVLMARLLGPADFGVFIAVTAFTSLVLVVMQFGLPPALIQARTLDGGEKDAAFWFLVLTGCAAATLTWLSAAPLGRLYESVQFAPVMLSMSLVFLLTAHSAVGLALMRRELAFARVAKINFAAQITALLLSLLAAFLGVGVYSLVIGALVGMVMTSIGIHRAGVWRPSRLTLAPVRSLLRYAWFSAINSGQNMAIERADNMIIGAVLGPVSLGLYNRAFSLARLPSEQFADSLGPVLLGALSRVQSDLTWSRGMFLKAVSAISVLTLPFLAILVVGGPTFVALLYGEAWADAGLPLQIMAFGGVFVLLTSLQVRLAFAQGLVKPLALAHFAVLVATIVLVFAAVPLGLVAVAGLMLVREVLWFALVALVLRNSVLALHWWETCRASLPALIAAIVAGVAGRWAVNYPADSGSFTMLVALLKLSLLVGLFYVLTLIVVRFLWRSHRPLASTLELAFQSGQYLLHRCIGGAAKPRSAG